MLQFDKACGISVHACVGITLTHVIKRYILVLNVHNNSFLVSYLFYIFQSQIHPFSVVSAASSFFNAV